MTRRIIEQETAMTNGWSMPAPPHDPRERELALIVEGWEARIFSGRKYEYFVTRGFWHLQLWHPGARISVLTPSRLTCGFYEAAPQPGWRMQAPSYCVLRNMLAGMSSVGLPPHSSIADVERTLVDEVVRKATAAIPRHALQ
jgi:hypothetical protein